MTNHRLFPLVAEDVKYAHVAQEEDVSNLWHKKYGHVNSKTLKRLFEEKLVLGLPSTTSINSCKAWSFGKQAWKEFPKGLATRARALLELTHAALVWPMKIPTIGDNLYFMLLTDDYSRYSWIYFLQKKSEALQHFKVFKSLDEKQLTLSLKALQTDRGGEFMSKEFKDFCNFSNMLHQLTAPRSH